MLHRIYTSPEGPDLLDVLMKYLYVLMAPASNYSRTVIHADYPA